MDDTVSLYGGVQVSKKNRIGRITQTGRPEFASLMSAAMDLLSAARSPIDSDVNQLAWGVAGAIERTQRAGPYRVSAWAAIVQTSLAGCGNVRQDKTSFTIMTRLLSTR